ncbi:hypothetical protein F4054_14775 [Candidatus Poribacteria bacterium]|nr:hypothetical protein [Candidatus Poribacteria bacterium]MYG05357.1 hypothetical protein [Candidatus Poribacteria bacterium]MYK23506.1 hypothetical protein [Candidatus Poribacteria bacterium]
MKYRIATFWCMIPTLLVGVLFFNSCTALKEAQERREKRLLEKRNASSLMLKSSDVVPKITPDALFGESDHYTLEFAEDLQGMPAFDEVHEREEFINSALGYMESLYEAMREHFGFHPEHKIRVTLHDVYRGSRLGAFTTTQYRFGIQNGRYEKFISGIQMDFPMQMYEKHGVRVHELTHAFTNIYYIPVWFSEGIAVLIQSEYAQGGLHPKYDSLKADVRIDLNGENELENWTGHTENSPLTQWRYRYAYTLVAELWKRYGNDFYIKVFELMEADGLHQQLESLMPTSILVYYFSQAAGEDLVPFFRELHFIKVRRLTKTDIVKYIEALNAQIQRRRE